MPDEALNDRDLLIFEEMETLAAQWSIPSIGMESAEQAGTPFAGEGTFSIALGGLGGGNGHGAGFLRAALRLGAQPHAISCTSGMIEWVSHYIAALALPPAERLDHLDARMVENVLASSPLGRWGKHMNRLMQGQWKDAWQTGIDFWKQWMQPYDPGQSLIDHLADRCLPNRLLSPVRTADDYEAIAATLQNSAIPVFFNSFNPRSGDEHIYLNEAAWRTRLFAEQRADAKAGKPFRGTVKTEIRSYLKDIDAKAVEAALWLYWYGFDDVAGFEGRGRQMDGAYHRHFMIRELTQTPRIYVVRPLHFRRRKRLPHNLLEVRDFETEMWFNATFAGEVRSIHFVNRMLEQKKCEGRCMELDGSEYHPIELITVETTKAMGFNEYFRERMPLYWNAYRVGLAYLAREFNQDRVTPEAADPTISGRKEEHRLATEWLRSSAAWLPQADPFGLSPWTLLTGGEDIGALWQRPADIMAVDVERMGKRRRAPSP